MSKAMNFSCGPEELSRALLAFSKAAFITALSSSGANFSELAPKVLVFTMLLPASK